jgi:hypothetical protein
MDWFKNLDAAPRLLFSFGLLIVLIRGDPDPILILRSTTVAKCCSSRLSCHAPLASPIAPRAASVSHSSRPAADEHRERTFFETT